MKTTYFITFTSQILEYPFYDCVFTKKTVSKSQAQAIKNVKKWYRKVREILNPTERFSRTESRKDFRIKSIDIGDPAGKGEIL